ncbi:endonuclease/exonuclease/phosphatase family protein [soil metagenome]
MSTVRAGAIRTLVLSSLNFVLALGAALGVLAWAGRFSSMLDLLNHATPLFFASSLALLALSLTKRPRPPLTLALALLGLLGSGLVVGRELTANWAEPKASRAAPRLTVLTQNVWAQNPSPAAMAASILSVDADVVVIEEAVSAGRPVVALVAQAYPYHADCTTVTQWCALAILSKKPIKTWSYHVGSWRPPEWDRLGLVRATIDGGAAGPVEIIGTQLIHPDLKGDAALQALALSQAVDSVNPKTAILVGDFNRTAWAYSLKQFDARMTLRRRTHGLATWPARWPTAAGGWAWPIPFLPIDQVYAGSSWRVVSLQRSPASTSDHYGVVTTLSYEPR